MNIKSIIAASLIASTAMVMTATADPAKTDVRALQHQIITLTADNAELTSEIADLEAAYRVLKGKKDAFAAQVSRLKADRKIKIAQINELKATVAELTAATDYAYDSVSDNLTSHYVDANGDVTYIDAATVDQARIFTKAIAQGGDDLTICEICGEETSITQFQTNPGSDNSTVYDVDKFGVNRQPFDAVVDGHLDIGPVTVALAISVDGEEVQFTKTTTVGVAGSGAEVIIQSTTENNINETDYNAVYNNIQNAAITSIIEEIADMAFDKGFDEGWTSGFDSGWDQGFDTGYEIGYSQGFSAGYNAGFNDARELN